MPYTIVIHVTRKPDLSPAEFRKHSEEIHLPLLVSLFGDLFPLTHTRHYIQRSTTRSEGATKAETDYPASVLIGTEDDFGYDACSYLVFEDVDSFQKFSARMQEPEVAARIAADEALFLKDKAIRAAIIDESAVTMRPSS